MSETVREMLEVKEKILLAPYAQFSAKSKGRPVFVEEDDYRTCYQRDKDKIIHSKAFRRLKHKTQVFSFQDNDHIRTRLTHTLEVSQIARTIARALSLNEDLVEAISLSHDLSHCCFAHRGEEILNEIFGSFSHNEYGAKLCRELNLSLEVIDGVLHHSSSKCGNTQAYTLEGRIVRIADKIAYLNADFEDAEIMGIINEKDIPEDIRKVLGNSRKERINNLIVNIINTSRNHDYIKFSKECEDAYKNLRKFMFERIYYNPTVRKNDERIKEIIYTIYNHELSKGSSKEEILLFMVGMTDSFALEYFNQIKY